MNIKIYHYEGGVNISWFANTNDSRTCPLQCHPNYKKLYSTRDYRRCFGAFVPPPRAGAAQMLRLNEIHIKFNTRNLKPSEYILLGSIIKEYNHRYNKKDERFSIVKKEKKRK